MSKPDRHHVPADIPAAVPCCAKPAREEENVPRPGDACCTVLEDAAEAVAVFDALPDGRFRYAHVNRAMLKNSGLTLDGMKGKYPEDIFPPGVAARINEQLRRCAAAGTVVRVEDGLLSFGSEKHIAAAVLMPLKGSSGRISFILAVADEAIGPAGSPRSFLETERHLRSFIDKVPLSIGLMKGGRMVHVNDSFLRQLGYDSADEVRSHPGGDFVAPEVRSAMVEKARMRERGQLPAEVYETVGLRKDGTRFPLFFAVASVDVEEGPISLIIGIDITDRERAENALKKSEQRFRLLLDKAPFATAIHREGRIEYVNDRFLQLYGYSGLDELRGRGTLETIAPSVRPMVAERQRLRAQGVDVPREYEAVGLRRDGSQFPFIIAVTRAELDEGMVSIVTSIDISDRKRAETALRESYEQVQRSLSSIIDTISTVIEIRDPFTAGHQKRVSRLAAAIAEEMGLPNEKREGVRVAALLHDVGKMYIPSELLSRPGKLNDMEMQFIKEYPRASYGILKNLAFPWPVAMIALQHQERFNGTGYPQGLAGENILVESRVLAVADVFEAMTAHRPYRPAMSAGDALAELKSCKGVLYDADAVDALARLLREKKLDAGAVP